MEGFIHRPDKFKIHQKEYLKFDLLGTKFLIAIFDGDGKNPQVNYGPAKKAVFSFDLNFFRLFDFKGWD